MRAANRGRLLQIALLAALAGCNHAPVPPAGTGAEEVAQSYYDALVRKDWSSAYALLDLASRHRCRQEQFERLALQHLQTLGFAAREVYVRACEEHGDEAIAHVALTGQAASQQRFYRDALVLRHESGSWRVVLSPKLGPPPSRQP
jgi:hypothetical protein